MVACVYIKDCEFFCAEVLCPADLAIAVALGTKNDLRTLPAWNAIVPFLRGLGCPSTFGQDSPPASIAQPERESTRLLLDKCAHATAELSSGQGQELSEI